MLDFQSISGYKSETSDKRKINSGPSPQSGINNDRPPPGNTISFGQPLRDSSTFQFQTSRAATPLTDQASRQPVYNNPPPENPNVTDKTLFQKLSGLLERLVAQVGSFFLGRRRDVPDAQERDNRRLNDFFTLDFLGESKVEPVQHSLMGDGSN